MGSLGAPAGGADDAVAVEPDTHSTPDVLVGLPPPWNCHLTSPHGFAPLCCTCSAGKASLLGDPFACSPLDLPSAAAATDSSVQLHASMGKNLHEFKNSLLAFAETDLECQG